MQRERIRYLDQRGLTLVESLLSLVLFSIIATAVYFVLLNGLKTENKIYNETLIRDEADLVMSEFINVLYTATPSKVKETVNDPNTLVYKLNNNTSKTIGFIQNKPVIDGRQISSNDFNFSGSTITIVDKSIKIDLLVGSNKNANAKKLKLESQFRLMEE